MIYKTKTKLSSFLKASGFRLIAQIATASFILTIAIPNLFINYASAYGQVQYRNIEMSTSVAAATAVTYQVSFQTQTGGVPIEGVVVDFCSNDPIIGDSCTAPTGFTVGASPTTNAAFTGLNPTTASSWTAASLNSGRTFILTDAGATSNIAASTTISFNITSVTNPSTDCSIAANICTFYARILTYSSPAGATGYLAGTPANGAPVVDAGGVALSTTSQITITSKVQEQLTFCVYTATLDAGNCNDAVGTSVTLGNNNGVLSTAGPFVDTSTKYDIQTNALHGAIIRFEGNTLTSGGGNTIEASSVSGMDAGSGTGVDQSTADTPQFGLCTWATAGAQSNLTASSTYSGSNSGTYSGTSSPCGTAVSQTAGTATPGGAGSAYFGYNITNAATTYGDSLASVVAGPYVQGQIAFMGNISNSTVAGIYTTTLTFIATGTY